MGRRPLCYIASFEEIDLPVPEKNFFFEGFTKYWRGGHLGYVTKCREQTFVSPTEGGAIQNLALIV